MGWAGNRANKKKTLKTQKQKSSAAQGVRYAWGGREAGQTKKTLKTQKQKSPAAQGVICMGWTGNRQTKKL